MTRLRLPFSQGIDWTLSLRHSPFTHYQTQNRFMASELSMSLVLLFELSLFTQSKQLWHRSICPPSGQIKKMEEMSILFITMTWLVVSKLQVEYDVLFRNMNTDKCQMILFPQRVSNYLFCGFDKEGE